MKVSRFLSLMICLLAVGTVWADAISESQARAIANRFFSANNGQVATVRLAHKAPSLMGAGSSAYYVFNSERASGGYVIVAGDDRVPAVLGYSDDGTLDMNDLPEALQDWLDDYAAQIAALDEGGKVATHVETAPPIAPLMHSQWSQNAPYNALFPVLDSGDKAVVGCVGTAMAQVMYYWKWPERPKMAIPSYVTETLGINMPTLPIVDFDWSAMQDTYVTDDLNSAGAQAASRLSLYCAQSVQMDFQKNTSSASSFDIPFAMFLYFNYSPSVHSLQRRFFTSEQWENVILEELSARRPVIYRGRKLTGGHAFVCDGYDGNGMFHINWGWNGKSNGYFLLSVLNPDLQGTGSASGASGYVIDQAVIVELEPRSASSSLPELEVYNKYVEVLEYTGVRTSSNQDFTVTQESHFLNCSDDGIGFDYGWGLYQGNSLIKIMEPGTKDNLDSWYYFRPTRTLSFGGGITSGTFRIVPIYSEPYADNWRQCIGAEVNYIEVVIDGNNCSVVGYGASATPEYEANNIYVDGTMNMGRPIDFTLDLTNKGKTQGDVIYLIDGNKVVSAGFADIEKNARGLVSIRYMPDRIGSISLKFAFDEDGTNVFARKNVVITSMPAAYLTGSAKVLNVTDQSAKIIADNKIVFQVKVTNSGSTTYDEDISVKLYKHIYGNTGSLVQALNQRVTLGPGATTTLGFNLDNVMDGWKYFAKAYYYSSGDQVQLASVSTYTVVFPEVTVVGDVNCDGEVTIADVNAVLDMILKGSHDHNGDVNGDGEVSIADINAVIDLILGQ